jgi:hypothetical protein
MNNDYISQLSHKYIEATEEIKFEWLNELIFVLYDNNIVELNMDIYNIIDGCFFE